MAGGHPAGSGTTKAVVQGPKGQQGALVRGQGRGSTSSSDGSTEQWEGLMPAVRVSLQLSPPESGELLPGRPWQDDSPLLGRDLGSPGIPSLDL